MGGIKNKLTSKVKTLLNSLPLAGEMPVAFRVGAHLASQKCDDKRADEMTKSSQSREGNNNNNKVPLWLKGNVRRKSDKGIVGAGDYDLSVSPDGLPAPFTQREPNAPAHALSIHSKSPLLYTLISVIILTILTIITISIKLSFLKATGDDEGANDTGAATLGSVKVVQLGTTDDRGEPLTVTYDDGSKLSADPSKNEVLNNDIVVYEASYNVTKSGTITLSFTMPANNTIAESSISEANGCMSGSKLVSEDTIIDGGDVVKSYTNNKAVCVRQVDAGSTTWVIRTNPWGENGATITPTAGISGITQASDSMPDVVTIGKPNYRFWLGASGLSQGPSVSYNLATAFGFGLYVDMNSKTGLLGVEPIRNGTWSVDIDMSDYPDDWMVDFQADNQGINMQKPLQAGTIKATKISAEKLHLEINGSITATPFYCPAVEASSMTGYCFYTEQAVRIGVPMSSLSSNNENYKLSLGGINIPGNNGMVQTNVVSNVSELTFVLSNGGIGTLTTYGISPYAPGWLNGWRDGEPVYTGEKLTLRVLNSQNYGAADYITNIYNCIGWSSNSSMITDLNIDSSNMGGGSWILQWGVLPTMSDEFPDLQQCMVADGETGGHFFNSYTDAAQYAQERGGIVNTLRIRIDQLKNGRDISFGTVDQTITGRSDSGEVFQATTFGTMSDYYSAKLSDKGYTYVPGLLSHTLTAIPSSTNPGKEDHITITTKTYNKDTNSKITINLPNGLTPKEGSFTITTGYEHNDETNTNEPIKAVLIEGENQDYTITANGGSSAGNVSYTITLDLDHIASTHHVPITGYDPIYPGESGVTNITLNSDTGLYEEVITTNNNNEDNNINNDDLPIAADNNGNGISHISTPIEFDVTVNEDTPSPSTLTINSTASGTGTDYASTTFKTASDTIAVAEPPKTFGYDLTASSNNIYAGDDLTYSYSISNTTDTNATNIQMLTVLPFNGDSRGTTGLKNLEEETTQASDSSASNPVSGSIKDSTNNLVSDGSSTITNPYTISHLSLSLPSDGASGLDTSATKLYYTLDL